MKTALAINEIYELDCFQFLTMVEDGIVDLAIIDPPYNMKKAEWDTQGRQDLATGFSQLAQQG